MEVPPQKIHPKNPRPKTTSLGSLRSAFRSSCQRYWHTTAAALLASEARRVGAYLSAGGKNGDQMGRITMITSRTMVILYHCDSTHLISIFCGIIV